MNYHITEHFLDYFSHNIDIVSLQSNLGCIAGLYSISNEETDLIWFLTESIERMIFSVASNNYSKTVQVLFSEVAMKSCRCLSDCKVSTEEKYGGFMQTLKESVFLTGNFPSSVKNTIANYVLPTDVVFYFSDDVLDEFLTSGIVDQEIIQKSIVYRESVEKYLNCYDNSLLGTVSNMAKEILRL